MMRILTPLYFFLVLVFLPNIVPASEVGRIPIDGYGLNPPKPSQELIILRNASGGKEKIPSGFYGIKVSNNQAQKLSNKKYLYNPGKINLAAGDFLVLVKGKKSEELQNNLDNGGQYLYYGVSNNLLFFLNESSPGYQQQLDSQNTVKPGQEPAPPPKSANAQQTKSTEHKPKARFEPRPERFFGVKSALFLIGALAFLWLLIRLNQIQSQISRNLTCLNDTLVQTIVTDRISSADNADKLLEIIKESRNRLG
ncbi:MAG: hypothetical protein PHU23_15895 [Dehalococcoidales bacterium]|nr:hypothetical protein [Dehalococcoidales bacterium]